MSWAPNIEFAQRLAKGMVEFDDELIENKLTVAITRAIRSWEVRRKTTPNSGQHPLEDSSHGSLLSVHLPWRPEDEDEQDSRERRLVAWSWAHDAWRNEDSLRPPPEGVRTNDLLMQSTWWVTAAKNVPALERSLDIEGPERAWSDRVIRVRDMEPSHARNTVAFLRRRAEGLKLQYELEALHFADAMQLGDHAGDAFDGSMNELAETAAVDWITEKPLISALMVRGTEDQ